MHFCLWLQSPVGKCLKKIKPLTHDLHKLSAHKGCLFWGNFVIIPDGNTVILATPHVAHSGITHCVWWPGNDSAIEKIVTKYQHMPSHSALSSKRTSFPMGSYQEVLVNNPNLSYQTNKKKSSFVDLWLGSESTCLCQMAAMPVIVKHW